MIGLACMVAAGCLGDRFQWEGNWAGNRSYKPQSEGGQPLAYTLGKVEVRIKNGRYDLLDGGMTRSGTVSADGKELKLTVDLMLNRKVKMAPDGSLKEVDANTVEYRGMGADPSPVTLKRETQPPK